MGASVQRYSTAGHEIRTYHISIVHTCTGVKAYAVPVVEFRSGRTYIPVVELLRTSTVPVEVLLRTVPL